MIVLNVIRIAPPARITATITDMKDIKADPLDAPRL